MKASKTLLEYINNLPHEQKCFIYGEAFEKKNNHTVDIDSEAVQDSHNNIQVPLVSDARICQDKVRLDTVCNYIKKLLGTRAIFALIA